MVNPYFADFPMYLYSETYKINVPKVHLFFKKSLYVSMWLLKLRKRHTNVIQEIFVCAK